MPAPITGPIELEARLLALVDWDVPPEWMLEVAPTVKVSIRLFEASDGQAVYCGIHLDPSDHVKKYNVVIRPASASSLKSAPPFRSPVTRSCSSALWGSRPPPSNRSTLTRPVAAFLPSALTNGDLCSGGIMVPDVTNKAATLGNRRPVTAAGTVAATLDVAEGHQDRFLRNPTSTPVALPPTGARVSQILSQSCENEP